MFELPRGYKGLEEAMQDVKTFAHDKGLERCIGLLPDGGRVFTEDGDDSKVHLPKIARGHRDMFIIHGHPRLPAELSDQDLKVVTMIECAGNMAVSGEDATVSWSTGIDDKVSVHDGLSQFVADMFIDKIVAQCAQRIDPGVRDRVQLMGSVGWDKEDWRWVVLSHMANKKYLELGFIKDYHLQQGDLHKTILDRYKDMIGE